MNIWQTILLSYVVAFLVWVFVCAALFGVSVSKKKNLFTNTHLFLKVMSWLVGITTGVGAIFLLVWMFTNGMAVWAIVILLIGGFSVVSGLAGSLLILPFSGVSVGAGLLYCKVAKEDSRDFLDSAEWISQR